MPAKIFATLAISLFICPELRAQNHDKLKASIETLSAPGKIGPDVLDCSKEEKLAIDCRQTMERLSGEFKKFREEASRSIDFHHYEVGDMLEGVKIVPELKDSVAEYKALKNPKAKDKEKVLKLIGISPIPDYNCFRGPDGIYLFDPKFNKCSSGFTRVDPYAVTTPSLEVNEQGTLDLVICRKVNLEPFSYEMCGRRNLEHGALWLDKNGARMAVTEIKKLQGKKSAGAKNYFFKRGETYNLYDEVGEMVDQTVRKKHEKCIPFLPTY